MEGQTSAQPRGTNHPFHEQGFCPTSEDYSACTAGLELLRTSCSSIFCKWVAEEGKERPRSGDPLTPRSDLRISNSPSRQGNKFIWCQKHPPQPPVIQHFCCHPEQQQSPSQGAFGARWGSDPPWGGLTLTGNQRHITANSQPGQTFPAPLPIIIAVP